MYPPWKLYPFGGPSTCLGKEVLSLLGGTGKGQSGIAPHGGCRVVAMTAGAATAMPCGTTVRKRTSLKRHGRTGMGGMTGPTCVGTVDPGTASAVSLGTHFRFGTPSRVSRSHWPSSSVSSGSSLTRLRRKVTVLEGRPSVGRRQTLRRHWVPRRVVRA